jgi:esterase
MCHSLSQPKVLPKCLIVVDVAPVSYPPFSRFLEYCGLMKELEQKIKPKNRREADEWLSNFIPQLPLRQFLLTNMIERESHPPAEWSWRWRVNLDVIKQSLGNLRLFEVSV